MLLGGRQDAACAAVQYKGNQWLQIPEATERALGALHFS